jgi:prevent-host-death family protein
MTRTPTPIETVKASEARQHFSELVNRVHETGARVMIEKNGVVVGGLVSREDMRRLRYLDEKMATANEAIDRFQAAFAGIPPEEIEREIERAIAEARAERHAAKK